MLRQTFIDGMSRAAASVSIVTTDGNAGREGATVSAMTSVSVDPGAPLLLVCMHHMGQTTQAICANKVFCVNVLQEAQSHLANLFAGRIDKQEINKFAQGRWRTLVTGAPVAVGALVSFDCTLTEAVRCGSHYIFIGEVSDVVLGEHKTPLVYANRSYRRLSDEIHRGLPRAKDAEVARASHQVR